MAGFPSGGGLKVAVVTGGHTFEVPAFRELWRSLDGVDAYVQSLEDWADDVAKVRDLYDVTLFYSMHQATPTGEEKWPAHRNREALDSLGANGKGIVVLHHATVAWNEWPYWDAIVGMENRRTTVAFDQTMHIESVAPDHPIARGVEPFDIVDETYAMHSPGEGSTPLLVTDHPKNMRVVAWARRFREAPVFCLQLGHDGAAWTCPGFRTVLRRGIEWSAGRL